MSSIGLLHLTDFHQGMGGQKTLWPNVKESFLDDLERLHKKAGPWDAIVFTGDLTQRGSEVEFTAFDGALNAILERLEPLGSKPVVLAVPGNHDLQRPSASDALAELAKWHEDAAVAESFFADRNSPTRQIVTTAFTDYVHWWNKRATANGLRVHHGELPGDFATTLEKDGLRLALVGLNSSFLQLRDRMREGELEVAPRQLIALHDDPPAWLRSHHAAVLLTHHPVEWLHLSSQARFRAEIDRPGRFVAHLFGHMHEAAARVLSEGGAPPRRGLQGLSLFGLEVIEDGAGKRTERLHGYAALRLSVQDRQGTLSVWPRSYEMNRVAGYQRMVPDHRRYDLDDEVAVWQFTPPLPFSSAERPDSKARPASATPNTTESGRMDGTPRHSTENRLRAQVLAAIAMLSALRKKAEAYRRQLSRHNAGLQADGPIEQLSEAEVAAVESRVKRLSTQIMGAPPADDEWQGLKDFCRPHDEHRGDYNRSNEAYYGWILHWTDATRLLLEGYLAASDAIAGPPPEAPEDSQRFAPGASLGGNSLPSDASSELDPRSALAKQVQAARIVMDFTGGTAPDENKLRRLDDDFYNDFWTPPKPLTSCRFARQQVDVAFPDRVRDALARIESGTAGLEARRRVQLCMTMLTDGGARIVNYAMTEFFGVRAHVALHFFGKGVYAMLLAALVDAGEALDGMKIPWGPYGSAFHHPRLPALYGSDNTAEHDEKLVDLDIFRPGAQDDYIRVSVGVDTEVGRFFLENPQVKDDFRAWNSPLWVSRYLVPQMVARSFLSKGPVVADFTGYLIGHA